MTAIRRYISPPQWWNQTVIDETVVNYIKAVEQLCLDAGLVKSDLLDNMDTNNITLPSFPLSTGANSYDNVCNKKLSFDLNDSMQSELPVRIEFTFGYYAYNSSTQGSTYYPYYNYTKVKVGIIDQTNQMTIYKEFSNTHVRSNSGSITDTSMRSRDGFPPYVSFSGLDSFICVRDGFVMMNILPDFSQTDNATESFTTEIYFAIERSFNETNTPTGDNINLISAGATTVDANGRLYTHVMSKQTDVFSTYDTMTFYTIPSQYSEGKVILYPFMHMDRNYVTYQSPNFCGIHSDVLSPNVELSVSVGDATPTTFIRTSNKNSSNYPSSSLCAALFKFE